MKPTLLRMMGAAPVKKDVTSRVLNLLDRGADGTRDFMLMLQGNDAGARIDVSEPMRGSIWVYRCIQIWQWIGNVPTRLEQEVGKDVWKPVKDAAVPSYGVFERPRHRTSQSEYIRKCLLHLAHDGEYFTLKVDASSNPTSSKNPTALRPLDPRRVTILKEDDDCNPIEFQYTQKRGAAITFTRDECIYARIENPYDNRGLGPVGVLRMTVDSEYYGRLHQKQNVKHSGRINHVVIYDAEVVRDDEDLKRVKKWWNASGKGAGNAGKDLHTTSIKDVKSLGAGSRDLDWLNGQKLNMREVLTAFSIPPTVGGDMDKATFSNRTMEQKALWEDVLMPIARQYIYDPHSKGLGLPHNFRIAGMFEETVPAFSDDRSGKIDDYKKLVESMVPPVEAARVVGLNITLRDQAHNTVWHGTSLTNDKEQQARRDSQAAARQPAPVPPSPGPGQPAPGPGEGDQEEESSLPPGKSDPEPPGTKRLDLSGAVLSVPVIVKAEDRERATNLQAEGRAELQRWFSKVANKMFYDQRVSMLERFDQWTNSKSDEAALKISGEPMADEPPITPEDTNSAYALAFAVFLLNGDRWDREVIDRFRRVTTTGIERHSERVAGSRQGWKPMRGAEVEAMAGDQLRAIQKVNAKTRDDLLRVGAIYTARVREGRARLPVIHGEMRDGIKALFNEYQGARSKQIGLIESGAAHGAAMLGTLTENRVTVHRWYTAGDERVRDAHRSLDGVQVRVGQTFKPGLTLRFPGDPFAPIEERAGCRCGTGPVLD